MDYTASKDNPWILFNGLIISKVNPWTVFKGLHRRFT